MKRDFSSILFVISMWWRILYGVFRLIAAGFLIKHIGMPVLGIFQRIFSHELAQDPTDVTVRVVNKTLSHTHYYISGFLISYLVFWALIDIWLSIDMLRHKLFAFQASMYLITFFLLYEIVRVFRTHSLTLVFFIIIDAVIFWLIVKEYRKLRGQSQQS